MKALLDESQPIFQQIAQMIMDDIVDGVVKEGERVPSENELSRFYNINRATARKGLQALVDLDIIYKQRGIGMFVKEGARKQVLRDKQKHYREYYIRPMLEEARRIGMTVEEVMECIVEEEGNL
ncbi:MULTISPECIES: GntR family transcriptional regulator [Paenibacillus]|uniref:GntR family transcriptional regulator n=1 Tax=Paenibacillus TaxID=44249 RepID=UPI001C0FE72B|nr:MULTISPECIES: GntR family transcriptional regulator [Paenibacillus]MBU5346190.1 GntR family transcriptional regulator [Paenibacillus lautus]MBX4148823.1 GntR family transcriptional regulator [Paenibacillus lautus]MCT1400463.1 GntR family transcriptional regulator [Paenibacillus sp. p3-SID867]